MKPLTTRSAFAAFYQRTHLTVFRYIYGMHGGPRQFVEDLTTETYLKAWDARHDFKGDDDAALGWLLVIAKRTVIDAARRDQRHPIFININELNLPAGLLTPEGHTLHREQAERLWRSLQHLTDDKREMLILRYMLGWQVQEIATHMEKNANTVAQTIKRSLEHVRRTWQLEGVTHD